MGETLVHHFQPERIEQSEWWKHSQESQIREVCMRGDDLRILGRKAAGGLPGKVSRYYKNFRSSTRTGRAEGQCRWLPSKECGFCGTCQTPAILTWFSAFRLLPLSQDEVGNTDDDVDAVDHSVEVQYANFYKERIPVLYYRWTKWTF